MVKVWHALFSSLVEALSFLLPYPFYSRPLSFSVVITSQGIHMHFSVATQVYNVRKKLPKCFYNFVPHLWLPGKMHLYHENIIYRTRIHGTYRQTCISMPSKGSRKGGHLRHVALLADIGSKTHVLFLYREAKCMTTSDRWSL